MVEHTIVFSVVFLLFVYSVILGSAVVERRHVIKEVILEAEAFGDIETQAEVMVQAAILDLREKRPVADVKLLLQVWTQRKKLFAFLWFFFFLCSQNSWWQH